MQGDWHLFIENEKIERIWSSLCKGFVAGQFGEDCYAFLKTNTKQRNYIITVNTPDYTNKNEVMSIERAIRAVGIKNRMWYRPRSFSFLQNHGYRAPKLHYSSWNNLTKISRIDEHFKPPY